MPPERTRAGNASVMATMMVADDSVEMLPNTGQAPYRAAPLRKRSSSTNAGNTVNAKTSQGRIITGLRPNRSDNQPPSGSQMTPLKPTTAVALNAVFADIPSVASTGGGCQKCWQKHMELGAGAGENSAAAHLNDTTQGLDDTVDDR
jgi:hypothetical protein